jgi:5-formyltetrahydrofolate cyclo-ligase
MVSCDPALTEKAALRSTALQRRESISAATRAAAAEAVAARPLPIDLAAAAAVSAAVVSGFWPIRSEINPLPLLRRFAAAGARLALPTIVQRGQPLRFRGFAFGEELAHGQWGIREPKPDAPELDPDVLLVPLAAFDRRGHRIGYGAGYYDLTLKALRAVKSITAIGLAFALQELDAIPALPHDARLDLVLTEREVIDCRGT